jgi:hypothetical protein
MNGGSGSGRVGYQNGNVGVPTGPASAFPRSGNVSTFDNFNKPSNPVVGNGSGGVRGQQTNGMRTESPLGNYANGSGSGSGRRTPVGDILSLDDLMTNKGLELKGNDRSGNGSFDSLQPPVGMARNRSNSSSNSKRPNNTLNESISSQNSISSSVFSKPQTPPPSNLPTSSSTPISNARKLKESFSSLTSSTKGRNNPSVDSSTMSIGRERERDRDSTPPSPSGSVGSTRSKRVGGGLVPPIPGMTVNGYGGEGGRKSVESWRGREKGREGEGEGRKSFSRAEEGRERGSESASRKSFRTSVDFGFGRKSFDNLVRPEEGNNLPKSKSGGSLLKVEEGPGNDEGVGSFTAKIRRMSKLVDTSINVDESKEDQDSLAKTKSNPSPMIPLSLADNVSEISIPSKTAQDSTTEEIIGDQEEIEEEQTVLLNNVEEMLEGFEWRSLGSTTGGGGGSRVEGMDLEKSLIGEVKALEDASIYAIIESDDRVGIVVRHIDETLAELERLEQMMGLYKTQLLVGRPSIS